jgi:hypothetical protein
MLADCRPQVDALQACLPEHSSYRFLDFSRSALPHIPGTPIIRPDIILVDSKPRISLSTADAEPIPTPCSTSQQEATTSAPLSSQWDEVLFLGI